MALGVPGLALKASVLPALCTPPLRTPPRLLCPPLPSLCACSSPSGEPSLACAHSHLCFSGTEFTGQRQRHLLSLCQAGFIRWAHVGCMFLGHCHIWPRLSPCTLPPNTFLLQDVACPSPAAPNSFSATPSSLCSPPFSAWAGAHLCGLPAPHRNPGLTHCPAAVPCRVSSPLPRGQHPPHTGAGQFQLLSLLSRCLLMPWEAAEDGRVLGSCTHEGKQAGAPGSWPHPGLILVVLAIRWKVCV